MFGASLKTINLVSAHPVTHRHTRNGRLRAVRPHRSTFIKTVLLRVAVVRTQRHDGVDGHAGAGSRQGP